MTPPKRPRGRPPKYPPDEVRRRLIDAAVATLRVSGVESGLDSVTLDGAIVDADVPRGMSYRIWRIDDDVTPQDSLRQATVLDILSIPAVAGLPATRTFTATEIDAHRTQLDSDDPAERRAVVSELVRRVGEFNHEALASSSNWRLYAALRTAAVTRPDTDPAILDALVTGEEYLINEYASFYAEMAETVGLILKPCFAIEEFSAAAYSLNEGLSMRLGGKYRRGEIVRSDISSDAPWTLFAIALEGLIFQFFDWADR